MRRVVSTILGSVLLCVAAGSAHSFGTIRSSALGQDAEHERITRQGMNDLLGPQTLSMLAGEDGTFGAVGAPDDPSRGLMSDAKSHCDGGDWFDESGYPQSKADARRHVEACRTYLFSKLDEAVADAGALVKKDSNGRWIVIDGEIPTYVGCVFNGRKGRAKCNVLEDMGLALHASQDFYSHSNWVDQPGPGKIARDNPPGLGNRARAPWLDPRKRDAPFPDGLITGCYDGFPEWMHCNYGWTNKSRVKHAYLNKDGKGKDRAKIGDNFDRAFRAAADDTWDKWLYLESEILARYPNGQGSKIICALRNDDAVGACNR